MPKQVNLEKRKADQLSPNGISVQSPKLHKMTSQKQKVSDLDVEALKFIIKESNKEMIEKLNELSNDVAELRKQNISLKQEIEKIKSEKEMDRRRMLQIEDKIKRNNLIFKGLEANKSNETEIARVCSEILKIKPPLVQSTKKIYERNGKMTVIAEVNSEHEFEEIFKSTHKLAGTSIYIERDLNLERQQDKKIMLHLKKEITAVSTKHKVGVRDDRLKVATKWLKWSKEKMLVCGQEDAKTVLNELYGKDLENLDINYNTLYSKTHVKN